MLRFVLLGLLSRGRRHGYELRAAFEELFGGTWSVNPGQVYTTLQRLERDDLVVSEVVEQELLPDRKVFSLTEAGRAELKGWLVEPAADPVRLKDELFVKVLVQGLVRVPDRLTLLFAQREHSLRSLAALTRLRSSTSLPEATVLLLDGAILHLEADLRWLDLVEERIEGSA